MSNRRYNTQNIPSRMKAMGGGIMRKGYLAGGQSKLDIDGDGKITGKDFAMLRNKKKKKKTKKPSMMMAAMKGKK